MQYQLFTSFQDVRVCVCVRVFVCEYSMYLLCVCQCLCTFVRLCRFSVNQYLNLEKTTIVNQMLPLNVKALSLHPPSPPIMSLPPSLTQSHSLAGCVEIHIYAGL